MKRKKKRIAIVTGPTGGHFFPGLAMGEALVKSMAADVNFFVPDRPYILSWLRKKEFEHRIIPEVKLSFSGNLLMPAKLAWATAKALSGQIRGKFDLIVLTGSYACLPFLLSGALTGNKIILHEQNVVPGKFTAFASRFADRIAFTFPEYSPRISSAKTSFTGYPVPEDFRKRFSKSETLKEFGLNPGMKTVLVLGGSQGALFLNDLVSAKLDYFAGKKLQFLHVAGKNSEALTNHYQSASVMAKVFDFYFDMGKLYSATDMMICRAGAGTLSEINEWKIPSLIIPYPHAGGHQRYNARYVAERGGCILLEQTDRDIFSKFEGVFDDFLSKTESLKKNLEEMHIADTGNKTLQLILRMLEDGRQKPSQ